MMEKESEYKEMFLAEALDNHSELNKLLTELEKEPSDKAIINAIFRITHTLKGNALGMGYEKIADLSHSIEDLFGLVREGKLQLNGIAIASVFKAVDVLGELLASLTSGKEIRYKGIKTKLDVLIQRTLNPIQEAEHENLLAAERNAASPAAVPTFEDLTEFEVGDEGQDDPSHVAFSDLVQVPVRKLDNLLNLVGELIIEKDRFMADQHGSRNEYNRLHRIASDLQYSVMDVRLVQVGFLFNKFHRVVRDAAAIEKKSVKLKLQGTETEIDRNVLQVISDSLIHLIRNSVGHGIESPEQRRLSGKPEEGTVSLTARSEADAVVIEVKDDGHGIDVDRVRRKAVEKGLITEEAARQMNEQEIILLIFEAGFSTVDKVNAISGRGVGMDVVKKALNSIGGNIRVDSRLGEGTTFQLTLPSTMAVKSTLLFEMDDQQYAIPLSYTESVLFLYAKEIHRVGSGLVATHLGKAMSIVFLRDLFVDRQSPAERILQKGIDGVHPEEKLNIVVVSHNGRTIGFVVDKLLQQKEIVEKQLGQPVDKISFVGGVTILGNGRVCLVLNVPSIVNHVFSLSIKGRTQLSDHATV